MKILLLAPQPFYRERGTPIAVDLLLRALAAQGHVVDVLTFHLGEDVAYPGVTLHRIPPPAFVKDMPPGFSLGKLFCDFRLWREALRMAAAGGYDLAHAVEEAVFIALHLKKSFGLPYVFDMDSSLPAQLVAKMPFLRPAGALLRGCERAAVRSALAVVAVCEALQRLAEENGARRVFLLRDISLLDLHKDSPAEDREAVRRRLGLSGFCFMYLGNLERYQGIDLLLESFAILAREPGAEKAVLAVIGGSPESVAHYRARAAALGIAARVIFPGPQPVRAMGALFQAADALVSPRLEGNNTPMKIYSYLASGVPVVATDLPTHTQVLTPELARLAPPRPAEFAAAMRAVLADYTAARQLAERARQVAQDRYSFAAFCKAVAEIYGWLEKELRRRNAAGSAGQPLCSDQT